MEPAPATTLRPHCLNFAELLAENIGLISPTMTAALIVPLMFATAGNGGWLAYAIGAVMLLFVALCLNQFAKRSSETGSMYAYTIKGLGPTAGGFAGWSLIWCYAFIGTAGVTGFTTFAQQLLAMGGITFPPILLFILCVLACWYVAYRDIQLSQILMLGFEALSVTLIVILCGIFFVVHAGHVDTDQLTLKGSSFSVVALGIVVAIFSLVGFEAATSMGHEAKNPTKNIPLAIIVSLIFAGVFFVIVTYVETWGLRNNNPTLDKLTAPLAVLSDVLKVPYFKAPIALGAMLSFFSLALSCINAGARLFYPMANHGLFHASLTDAHKTNRTPHVAVSLMSFIVFAIPVFMLTLGLGVGDAFNDAGTLAAFGFIVAYGLVSIAAPFYLKRIGELKAVDVVVSVLAVVLLLLPTVGSLYPVPAPPLNTFPYLFVAYLLAGYVWFVAGEIRAGRLGKSEPPAAVAES